MAEFNCIRRSCIEDDQDAYHYEIHLCFVCGYEFDPTPDMRLEQCPECKWYKCPGCGGCQCTLDEHDDVWIRNIWNTYCVDKEKMASFRLSDLPNTHNPCLKEGIGLQLCFCRRWAAIELGLCS